MTLDRQATIEAYATHVNPAFVKLLGVFGYGRVFTRATGVTLWDSEERAYLDMLSSFGATSLGHRHPRLVQRMIEELSSDRVDLMHVGPSRAVADLAATLADRAGAPLEIAMLCTSGAEAVDAALKLARAATGRRGVVYCADGFHGTSLGTLSVMGSARLRAPFEPLLEGARAVPFGDLDALRSALDASVGAFVVEPILGEGGVVIPPDGYLRDAGRMCARNGALLILDEVQTGMGRSGHMFAFQAEEVVPDILVLGKALGGGIVPVSAALTTREWHDRAYGSMQRFDLQGCTYAGYALGCAAARATLEVLDEERLVENAAARGKQMVDGLRARLANHPLVREVRGRGLLVGIELGPTHCGLLARAKQAVARNVFGQWLAVRLLEAGIVCQPAALRWDVLRLEPPLTIGADDVDRAVEAVGRVLDEYRDVTRVLADVAARMGRQFVNGWTF